MYSFETIYFIYINYIHTYVIICNNNVNYTILYNKKRKMKNINILLYSMCIIKSLFNSNTEDIQISMIMKYIHIIYTWQYNHNIICPATGPLHVLCRLVLVSVEIFSDNKKCNQFTHA